MCQKCCQPEAPVGSDVPVVEVSDGEISGIWCLIQNNLDAAEKPQIDLFDDNAVANAFRFFGENGSNLRQRGGIDREAVRFDANAACNENELVIPYSYG